MLKIKDNVDLEELERFGFKPKYNVDTGKIEKYVCKTTVGYREPREVTLLTVYRDTYQVGQYETIEYWKVIFEEKCQEAIDLLYDLIKADMVVKE